MRQSITPLESFNKIANSFKQKSGGYVWEWILRIWDNVEMNSILDQTALIDMQLAQYKRCQKFV